MQEQFDHAQKAWTENSTAKSSHNKGFTPTRTFNPCQICNDTSGKCRETESVLLCMNITTDVSNPNSFKFIGLTLDGLWGKFVKDNGQNFTQQQREQWASPSLDKCGQPFIKNVVGDRGSTKQGCPHLSWIVARQQEQKLQKLSRLKAEHKRSKRSLDESDRDKEIRKVLAQLSLKPEQKTDLQRNMRCDEQIASFIFRLVNQWQKLEIVHRFSEEIRSEMRRLQA